MSEDMARALGASGALTVVIAGKECTVRPLGLQELTEVERDCLERFRRHYLETYRASMDLLPGNAGLLLLERKIEEAARWDVGDLPAKYAHDPARVVLTDALRAWVAETYGADGGSDDRRTQRIATSALDQGMLSDEEYRGMTGSSPPKVRVGYVNWWITGSYEGMVTFCWVCFRHNDVTRDQVQDALRGNMALLVDLSREIERLSSPSVGNG